MICVQIVAATSCWRCIQAHWNWSAAAFAIFKWWKRVAARRNEIVLVARTNGFCIILVRSTVSTQNRPTAWLKRVPTKKWKVEIVVFWCEENRWKCLAPIWIEIHVADWIFDAQYACIRVNDINESSIATLQTIQLFAFVKTWPSRIQASDSWNELFGQVMEMSASIAANMGAQWMTWQKINILNFSDIRWFVSSQLKPTD